MGRSGLRGGIRRESGGQLVRVGNAMVGLASADDASEGGAARARQAATDLGCVLSQRTLALGDEDRDVSTHWALGNKG
jgi:hypothetical protein